MAFLILRFYTYFPLLLDLPANQDLTQPPNPKWALNKDENPKYNYDNKSEADG